MTGYFYNNGQHSFRKYLNIKRIDFRIANPDLMVVMMNPGSSKQYPEYMDCFDCEVLTNPDYTQYRIMKIMNVCNFNYARILIFLIFVKKKAPFF